jgi:hypothetical protein
MPHPHRNFILAYILLVAVPVVGLIGVLKSGRKLVAPISIDGQWKLQVDPVRLAALPCGKALADSTDAALAISQSGKNFTLSLSNGPRSSGSGQLDNETIKASIAPSPEWAGQAGCGAGRELTLLATVDPRANPRSLAGWLSVADCPSCDSVEFRAVKQIPPARRTTH